MEKFAFVKIFFKDFDRFSLILILVGTLLWSLTMIKSGLVYSYGMGFWGPNGHDGIWHISVSESLSRGSWKMPVFAGENIQNYHIGFDILLAGLHKLTFIPVVNLYFQILPPIFAFLIGYFAYRFVYVWKKSQWQAFWAMFFVYFGGSWGWMISLFRNKSFEGESMFWAQQSISTLINPPFALSLIFIFSGLWLLITGLETKRKSYLIIATFLFGALIQVKVYAGLLVLSALLVSSFWYVLKRGGWNLFKVFTGTLILSILLFSPVSSGANGLIVFKPFWFLEQVVSTPDRFYWPKMAEAMINYRLEGNLIKSFAAYGLTFAIFWFGNLGSRMLKEIQFVRHLKRFKDLAFMEIFIYTVIGFGVLVPTLFIQRGTPWNTIQFLYFALIFSGILSGIYFGELFEKYNKTPFRAISALLLVTLTIPTTLGTLIYHYLPPRPPARISQAELEALEFLSSQPDGIVMTLPFSKERADGAIENPPRPLYLYESTAYVSALSGKKTYLEDEVNLEITNYDWQERRLELENYLIYQNIGFLRKNNIDYLYFVKPLNSSFAAPSALERVFTNEEVDIYRVGK